MSTSRVERPRLVLTSGEPAGVGPELCAQVAAGAAGTLPDCELTILGDRDLLADRARAAGVDPSALRIGHHPLAVPRARTACWATRTAP